MQLIRFLSVIWIILAALLVLLQGPACEPDPRDPATKPSSKEVELSGLGKIVYFFDEGCPECRYVDTEVLPVIKQRGITI